MNKSILKQLIKEEIATILGEGLEGPVMGVDHKKARTEEEASQLEKQGYQRVDKRNPSFKYRDEKGEYIPLVKKLNENKVQYFVGQVMTNGKYRRLDKGTYSSYEKAKEEADKLTKVSVDNDGPLRYFVSDVSGNPIDINGKLKEESLDNIESSIYDIIMGEVYLRDVPYSMEEGAQELDPDSVEDAAKKIVEFFNNRK
jgi:hypothetical protein